MVLSVQKNYVSSSCNFRHGDYPNGGYCGNLNKFISSYSHLVCRTSRKREKKKGKFQFLMIPSQMDGRKLKTLIWSVIAKYSRKLKFRIQFSLQVKAELQRQFSELEFNIHKCIVQFLLKHKFFSLKSPSILSKINRLRLIYFQNKSNFNKLVLIIYINMARIAVDHTASFKSALLEFFTKTSRVKF